jgi:uncharacterized protein YuzE
MKIEYFKDTDTLYIELLEESATMQKEIRKNFVLDLAPDGRVVGIEIEHASEEVKVKNLLAIAIPDVEVKSAGML